MKIKRKIIISLIIIGLIGFITQTPLMYAMRSYIIMFPYSLKEKYNSVLKENNIDIKIPGGTITQKRDWYPFTLYHNDNGSFSKHVGRDLSLSILFTFGNLDLYRGTSSFFDPNSNYYSSFYGGYVVKDNTYEKFGINENGTLDINEASILPEYDYKNLVLSSLNCPKDKMKFEVEISNIQENVSYAGFDDWYRIDSTIKTNGVAHRKSKNLTAYIQYGIPSEDYIGEDFPITQLQGRTYVKYFEAVDLTIFLYIMAPNKNTIMETDKHILSETIIKIL